MLALKFSSKNECAVKDVESPRVVEDSLLIRVIHAPVCGTDLAILEGKVNAKPGVSLGHEYYGLVTDVGDGVRQFAVNDMVIGSPSVPCLTCYYCKRDRPQLCLRSIMFGVELDGSFAEYMLVPSPDRVLIETKMDGKIAALIGDTFATGLHAVEQAGLSEGEAVAIIGAGPVGCTTLISALRRKPSNVYVIARSKYRLEIAKKLGGIVVDATEARKRILDETLLGVDAVIDCAGSQATIDLAMKLLKKGGRAVITSVMSQAELSMLDVMMGEKRLIGSYCPPGPKYLAKTLEFVQTNNLLSDLSCLITHEFDLRKGLDAISSFNSPDRMKILINP